MNIISLSVLKDATMDPTIIFKDLTRETVLKGLRTLKVFKGFKLELLLILDITLVKTIRKSSLFQESFK